MEVGRPSSRDYALSYDYPGRRLAPGEAAVIADAQGGPVPRVGPRADGSQRPRAMPGSTVYPRCRPRSPDPIEARAKLGDLVEDLRGQAESLLFT